jgi:hypothetical protein
MATETGSDLIRNPHGYYLHVFDISAIFWKYRKL